MAAYLLIFGVAAVTTAAVMPLVILMVRRLGAVDVPADPRKVHTEPVPTLGGLGMLVGFAAAMAVAATRAEFADLFSTTSEPLGLALGVGAMAIVGIVDDLKGLPATVKLAGQIIAVSLPVLFGIQIVYAWVPGLDVVVLAPDLGFPLTIVALIAMVNAVNLIDGLDGLAAGVVAIGAMAFFAFTQATGFTGIAETAPSAAPLVAAITTGMCLGFLLYNFHPARIFMGDTGAMTLGLLLGASGVSFVGRTTAPGYAEFAGSFPLLVPALVLAIPFVDTAFAVARRAYRGDPITMADKGHLHHLLIAFGHSHRRAVLTMYYWSAVLAFAAVGWVVLDRQLVLVAVAGAVLAGLALTALGVRSASIAAHPPSDGDADGDGDGDSDDAGGLAKVTDLRRHLG